ncbi:MAG: hypothetical protein JO327_06355 [Nitrososphaeraceae archaeon]|nr:hypothetical protein [Nitrososphaeraceae archaeon]
MPSEHFGKVLASAYRGLEEMKRVLKLNGKMIILEIDPNTGIGKRLKIIS